MILEDLGVQANSRFLHEVIHSNVEPPRRPLAGGVFPTNKEIRILFRQSFAPGSPRLPDMLTLEVKAIHLALRHSLLPRIGYGEAITSLQ